MKKLNSLAKILFFFFAILSFSLVIVSCNDDEEEKETIDFRTMDLKEYLQGMWVCDYENNYYDTTNSTIDTMIFKGDSLWSNVWWYETFEILENDTLLIHLHNTMTGRTWSEAYYPIERLDMNTFSMTIYALLIGTKEFKRIK